MYGRESLLKHRIRLDKRERVDFSENEENATMKQSTPRRQYRKHCRRTFLLILFLAVSVTCFILFLTKLHVSSIPSKESQAPMITRFPTFGSRSFQETCSWTLTPPSDSNCTIFVRPRPTEHEGMTQWLCTVVTNYIDSKVRNCKFRADYGPSVNLSQVIAPNFDWIASKSYNCRSHDDCQEGIRGFIRDREPNIPFYRGVYNKIASPNSRVNHSQFQSLSLALPGFSLDTGMSCSLAALFDLAPSATQFEPQLFSKLLPTLRDPNALVITVYIRTGQTDQMVLQERNVSVDNIAMEKQLKTVKMSTACAMQVEQEFLNNANQSYSRVVWNVVTDSVSLKEGLMQDYSSNNIWNATNKDKKPIPRVVLTTSARGKHTRTMRNPSTADFAEALIDWILIGESDVVVSESTLPSSFETTASLRTNRPLYITPENKRPIYMNRKSNAEEDNDKILPCIKKQWIYD